ncbi:Uncharacterized protein FWK35_00034147 [Aphis craccivora]|uniref:C2H2-type domain-containing protein n=1 Tax=Aphis craccivora TaxID=307492 RepID=A0A6G0VSF1_APHCR|nr:Uncharacterized protein FWK35_00034147 [Aphis craccivora]
MYKCDMCLAVFKMKWNLARHVNTHNGIRYSCTVCEKKYTTNSNLNKHMKNVHAILHAPPAKIVQSVTLIGQPERDSVIKFAPRIIRPALPDVLTGGSNMSDDEIYYHSYTTSSVNGKRVSTADTSSVARSKKKRPVKEESPGFVEISASKARTIVWYYAKNTGGIKNYTDFLRSLESDLKQMLKIVIYTVADING